MKFFNTMPNFIKLMESNGKDYCMEQSGKPAMTNIITKVANTYNRNL